MEKVVQSYDKERLRMAMLKHEETFREQVYELHRLYKIQKMMMDSVGLNQQQQQMQKQERYLVESKKALTLSHQNQIQALQINGECKPINGNFIMGLIQRPDDHQAGIRSDGQEHIAESNINNKVAMMMDEGEEIELTLSLGPLGHNPRRRRPDMSESGQSVSSSSTGSSQTKKTSPKNNTNHSRGEQFTWGGGSFPHHQGVVSEPVPEPGFSNGQQTNPPWLFHALSLKLT